MHNFLVSLFEIFQCSLADFFREVVTNGFHKIECLRQFHFALLVRFEIRSKFFGHPFEVIRNEVFRHRMDSLFDVRDSLAILSGLQTKVCCRIFLLECDTDNLFVVHLDPFVPSRQEMTMACYRVAKPCSQNLVRAVEVLNVLPARLQLVGLEMAVESKYSTAYRDERADSCEDEVLTDGCQCNNAQYAKQSQQYHSCRIRPEVRLWNIRRGNFLERAVVVKPNDAAALWAF